MVCAPKLKTIHVLRTNNAAHIGCLRFCKGARHKDISPDLLLWEGNKAWLARVLLNRTQFVQVHSVRAIELQWYCPTTLTTPSDQEQANSMAEISLPAGANMRDIHDLCVKNGLVSLAQGMIEFPPPVKLREIASKKVLDPSVHTYRNRMGNDDYKEAISSMLRNVYGEQIEPDSVLACAGVAGGVSAALLALRARKPDAIVALIEPYYTFHTLEVERAFLRYPVIIPSVGENAEPNFAELKRGVIAGEIHGVIATNPQNPTGRVFTADEVLELRSLAVDHNLFLIMDECYLDMLFHGCPRASPTMQGVHRNIVCCRGFSKCLGCQSWRVGYAVSAPETLQEMMRMMDPFYICVNWTQHAMAEYFKDNSDDFVAHVTALNILLQDNWRILSAAFAKRFGWQPLEPNGTMYGMFKHSDESDLIACEKALKAGVGICPGSIFFGDCTNPPKNTGWVRIHCGVTKEKAEKVVAALENVNGNAAAA